MDRQYTERYLCDQCCRWHKETGEKRSEWIYFTAISFLQPANILCGMTVKQKIILHGMEKTTRNITAKIKVPLWNEEYDSPDDPTPYGVMGWHEG